MKKRAQPITILLADSDTPECLALLETVKTAQASVHLRVMANGAEVLEYLHQRGRFLSPIEAPRPDLIVLELDMPRKGGRQTLAEIKADSVLSRIPVALLGSSAAELELCRVQTLGADFYLTKPLTLRVLVNTMDSLAQCAPSIFELPGRLESRMAAQLRTGRRVVSLTVA